MAEDKFFNFHKQLNERKEINIRNWGLNIQKREYQDIVESHMNRPETFFRRGF